MNKDTSLDEFNATRNLERPQNPSPSYYSITPAEVRYSKELEPNAKLLYGEITALCNKEGFCWATNKYFANLYDVTTRAVQFWLESLVKNKFIYIELETKGFGSSRRIYLSENHQKMFTERKNLHTPMKISSGGGEKNFTHNTTSNTTSKTEVSVASEPLQKLSVQVNPKDKIALSSSELFKKVFELRKDWTSAEIAQAWKILGEHDGVVWDWWRFIEGTIDNIRRKKKSENIINSKRDKLCKNTQKNKLKRELSRASDQNTEMQPLQKSTCLATLLPDLQNGSRILKE